MKFSAILCCFLLLLVTYFVQADIPVHCTYENVVGEWTFYYSDNSYDNTVQCNKNPAFNKVKKVQLDAPPYAKDDSGNVGYWTIIYDEGFEVVIDDQKFFGFFNYKENGNKVVSLCNETSTSSYHEIAVGANNWGCFVAHKTTKNEPISNYINEYEVKMPSNLDEPFKQSHELIERINKHTTWKAKYYPQFESDTLRDTLRRSGGVQVKHPKWATRSIQSARKMTSAPTFPVESIELPESFDWRDVDGVNYVSPVRDQGQCGSCYTFAAAAMVEARMRIASHRAQDKIISTQNIVSCSEYSQDCDGGFSFLVSKYGQDFGFVDEECFPYVSGNGQVPSCSDTCKNPTKRWVTNYHYIGGYYGASNEKLMMAEIYQNGPVAVGFQVLPDFRFYQGGVYYHDSTILGDLPEWVETNHAVLVVGWGFDEESGMKYWIVKNSWGKSWGMDGYFWIRRGTDEVGIESMPLGATPIV